MKRIERIRLYPTPNQEQRLRFALDVTRELYNALLQERRDAYRDRGITISTKRQYAELTALRQEDARVADERSWRSQDCRMPVRSRLCSTMLHKVLTTDETLADA